MLRAFHRGRIRTSWPVLAALGLVGGSMPPAQPAEVFLDARLGQRFEYDSNIELREDGDDAAGSRTRIGATLGTRTPAVELALDGEFRLVRFFDRSSLDSEDFSVSGRGAWLWRRAALDLQAGVLRDTTRELLDTETGGFVEENRERLTFDVTSSLNYLVSPVDTGGLTFLYRERVFPDADEAEALGLREFSFFSAGANWLRQLSPALGARAALATSWFDSDLEDALAFQARLGARYELTPALSLDGTAGPTVVSTDREGTGSSTEIGALWNAALDYRPSADASMQAQFFQELDPQSAGGALNFRTGLALELDYALTRHASLVLPALVQRQDPIEGGADTRYYARVQPTLVYRLTPQLALETSYRFRWQSFEDEDDAISNAVFLGLRYDLPSLLTSR